MGRGVHDVVNQELKQVLLMSKSSCVR